MYSVFAELMKERGVTALDVSKATGIHTSTLTDWKKGRYTPKEDKRRKIADYFGVSLEYLDTGIVPTDEHYYLDPATRQAAEELRTNKDLRVLFDAARNATPEDLRTAHAVLLALKRKEQHVEE